MGGDALRGASTAINAIGDGRKAAQEMIDQAGLDFKTKSKTLRSEKSLRQHLINKSTRIKSVRVTETSLDDRKNFKLVQSPLTLEQGIEEASRCFQCDEVCSVCTTVCPNLALMTYEVNPATFETQKIKVNAGKVEILKDKAFEVSQKYQILHIADWCNKCGNCNTFCPTASAPYLEKPHLFLNRDYFENEIDGFFLGENKLLGKFEGKLFSFEEFENEFCFQTEQIELNLNKDLSIENYTILKEEDFELDLDIAVQMKIILHGVHNLTGLPPDKKH